MKQKLAFCCAGLLCLLAACTDKSESLVLGQQGGICIIGSADGFTSLPQTRTQVGDVSEDGALLIEWSAGDRIGVFGDVSTANALFTGNNDAPAPTTTFAGTLTGGDMPVYAYYPYQEGVADKTVIPIEIPAEQMYTDESSVAQYDFKASREIVADPSGGYRVQFRQLAALVRFEIDLTGVQSLADDELLMNITIHPTDNTVPMTGSFTYNLTDLDAGLQPGDATNSGITLLFTYPPTAREKAIAYAVVAPGKHEGETWTCTFTTDRQTGTFTTTALCDFEAGKYYTVPLTASVLENNDAVIEDIPENELEETANCYIVTAPGEHSFKATVIGNGVKGIISGAGFHTDTPYINPKSAKVLWSTTANFVSDVKLENGRVHYVVNQATGNAVIAVYSGFDCQGDILWSWHIWGTDGVPEDEEYINQAGATFLVMDRDLGAIRVGDNRCVQYQWGRKDPFKSDYAPPYYYVDGITQVNIQRGWPVLTIDNATILDAVRNPMQIISGSASTQYNWLGEDNFYLWGDAGRELPELLTDSQCGAGWEQQKTIYDPSPIGYRVANIFTFSGFTKMESGSTGDLEDTDDGIPLCLERLDYINFTKANNSEDWWFKKNADDNEGSCYPGMQARSGKTGDVETGYGVGGRWWAAEAYLSTDGKPMACYMETDDWKNSSPMSSSAHIGNIIQTYARTNLLRDVHGVRCVREK